MQAVDWMTLCDPCAWAVPRAAGPPGVGGAVAGAAGDAAGNAA